MAKFPDELQNLISNLKKLPGIGTRTAERFAFELITWTQEELGQLGRTLSSIRSKIPPCPVCGCLTDAGQCAFCDIQTRDPRLLCILASQRDVYAMEETKSYRGLYHVIEHLLSPLDGRYAHTLKVDRIESRIRQHSFHEVIIAFDSTIEGDATALFLKEKLSSFPIKISRLAFGLPVGSPIDHIDRGTLCRALTGRQSL